MECVWQEVKKILNQMSVENISFDNIGLILGLGWSIMRNRGFLYKKCEEYGFPARFMQSDVPLEFVYTRPSAAKPRPKNEGILTICGTGQVSSSEWPFVIFVDYRGIVDQTFQYVEFFRDDHRARTRATAELIEITAIRVPTIPTLRRSLSDSWATCGMF